MTLPAVDQEAPGSFAGLANHGVVHAFVGKVPGIDVNTDRSVALTRLENYHYEVRRSLGVAERVFVTAEQVHGNRITVLPVGGQIPPLPCAGSDGVITNRADVCLCIYVADCCAVYLVDPVRHVIGLVHSGRKGTEFDIVTNAFQAMSGHFGTQADDLVVQLSPCIRPPWYEADFAAEIAAQCHAAGITRVFDAGVCTAANPDRYYSYRREKGRTGRMLALLALR